MKEFNSTYQDSHLYNFLVFFGIGSLFDCLIKWLITFLSKVRFGSAIKGGVTGVLLLVYLLKKVNVGRHNLAILWSLVVEVKENLSKK